MKRLQKNLLNDPLKGYPIKDGKIYCRFDNTLEYMGKVDYYNIPPEIAAFLTELLSKMLEKCKKFNIPMLRGVVVMGNNMRRGSAANIGDGTLCISYETLIDAYTREKYNHLYNPPSTWKRGMPRKNRPQLSTFYFEDWKEVIASLLWHEFGHHVHHTYLTNLLSPTSEETYFLYCQMPPLEQRILDSPRSGRKNHLATKYGARRPLEWWAENFTLYSMGREDLVSSSFFKIIHDVERGNLSNFYSASKELNCLLSID